MPAATHIVPGERPYHEMGDGVLPLSELERVDDLDICTTLYAIQLPSGGSIMAVYETFAKRKRAAENAGKPVAYIYDDLPRGLRVQIGRILLASIEDPRADISQTALLSRRRCWGTVYSILTKEMRVTRLTRSNNPQRDGYAVPCLGFINSGWQVDEVLSLIELLFRAVEMQQEGTPLWCDAPQQPHDAIKKLNDR